MAGELNIVLFDVDSCIKVAWFIECYFIVLFEGVEQMIGVALAYIFGAKIINYEGK